MKIGIVDYGMGNIHSLKSAIFKINPQIEIILSNKYSVEPIDIVKIFEKKLNKIVNFKFKKIKKQIWPLYYRKNAHYFRKAKITFDRNYLLKNYTN